MNYAFKGFFDSAESAESAYFALRSKNLATDIETSDFSVTDKADVPRRIAYNLEGIPLLASIGTAESVSSATILTNNDPRVVMTPLLFNKKQAQMNDACFLYGHCRKKDIEAVTACLKRSGAFSVLSSELNRKPRLFH